MAASKDWSSNGSASAMAATHGAAPAGRCARMSADGSTAVRARSGGSYDPVPAPTFTTVRASPSASQTCAAIRGSVRRVTVYVDPMLSYNGALDILDTSPPVTVPLTRARAGDATSVRIVTTREIQVGPSTVCAWSDGPQRRVDVRGQLLDQAIWRRSAAYWFGTGMTLL